MAIGTVTLVAAAKARGPIRHDVFSFPGDSAYPTGGSVISTAILAKLATMGVTNYAIVGIVAVKHAGYMLEYVRGTGKLKVSRGLYDPAADTPFTECDALTDLSGVTFELMVVTQ